MGEWEQHSRSRLWAAVRAVVALALILIAFAFAFPYIETDGAKAKSRYCGLKLRGINTAIDSYYIDTGVLPQSLQGLIEPGPRGWRGPYLKTDDLVDAMGRRFHYVAYPPGRPYDLYPPNNQACDRLPP